MSRSGASARTFAVVALAVAGCQAKSGTTGAGSPSHNEHPLVGAQAPAFELPARLGQGSVSPEAHRGKFVIVDFWATWCEPCRQSFPFYQRLVNVHGGRLVVLGVSVDEEPGGIAEFARQTGANFPIAWDEGQAVAARYQPSTMPTSYALDENGIVRFVHAGFRAGDEAILEERVGSLMR
jgi:cytochrome c biogenesis protein CcmG/thiol:disulfide interchange protein DsbE